MRILIFRFFHTYIPFFFTFSFLFQLVQMLSSYLLTLLDRAQKQWDQVRLDSSMLPLHQSALSRTQYSRTPILYVRLTSYFLYSFFTHPYLSDSSAHTLSPLRIPKILHRFLWSLTPVLPFVLPLCLTLPSILPPCLTLNYPLCPFLSYLFFTLPALSYLLSSLPISPYYLFSLPVLSHLLLLPFLTQVSLLLMKQSLLMMNSDNTVRE